MVAFCARDARSILSVTSSLRCGATAHDAAERNSTLEGYGWPERSGRCGSAPRGPPAGRAGRAASVISVGVGPADPPASLGETGNAGRAVLDSTPNHLIWVDTTPAPGRRQASAAQGKSPRPLAAVAAAVSRYPSCVECGTGQVPEPVPCVSAERCTRRAQALLSTLRPRAAPAPWGRMPDL